MAALLQKTRGCLSNPRSACSVASGQSCAFSQSAGGVATVQRDMAIPPSGQYQGFLGQSVQARAYSEAANTAEFAVTDFDLQCIDVNNCTWRNDKDDQLDWVVGSGNVAPAKLNLITGSNIVPGVTFLILASDARPAVFAGSLISRPIGCQPSSGLLSFRYWRSRARIIGKEPDLDVCTRKLPDTTLENCLTIQLTDNHTILASIPPMPDPFEIVIRGYGFENEPEGGLIILDQLDYFAHIDSPESCAASVETNTIPVNAIVEDSVEVFEGSLTTTTAEEELLNVAPPTIERNVVSREVMTTTEEPEAPALDLTHHLADEASIQPKEIIMISDPNTEDGCRALECNLSEAEGKAGCAYRRVGDGARGEGFRVGWRVIRLPGNVANQLTGIHISPDPQNSTGPGTDFLVADFPGFERNRDEHRFVLESPEYLLDERAEAYLSFKKYLATQGIELLLCSDSGGHQCFWDAFQHSADPFTRRWTKEIVKLPHHLNKFFIICSQDSLSRANVGQVGLASITLYSDAEATVPFCEGS